jgi:ATP-dependent helicase YprA (DUF1998 family)
MATFKPAPADSPAASFRLRPPPPLSAEAIELAAHRAAQIRQREQKQEKQRVELKEKNKKLFVPFHFATTDVADSTAANSAGFLGDQTFESLGITNPAILANLAKTALGTATHIQAQAIPALLRHESVVLQAQTGSGKTLAYLLPLINAVDPRKREVRLGISSGRQLRYVTGSLTSGMDDLTVCFLLLPARCKP